MDRIGYGGGGGRREEGMGQGNEKVGGLVRA